MQKLKIKKHNLLNLTLALILTGLFSTSCSDIWDKDPEPPPPPPKNPLAGSVWVHHPDTDPRLKPDYSSNVPEHPYVFTEWFDMNLAPIHSGQPWFPLEGPKLSFTEDRVFNNLLWEKTYGVEYPQRYWYTYNEPYISIHFGMSPGTFADVLKYANYCPNCFTKTIEKWECHCNNIEGCLFWFLGKVEGNTMVLHQRNPNQPHRLQRIVTLVREQ